MSMNLRRPGALAAAAVASLAAAALANAPAALAAPAPSGTYTWSGQSNTSNDWNVGANWAGGTAPGSAISTLNFGDLSNPTSNCDAATPPAGLSCYTAIDNLGPATVGQINIGGGQMYAIYPTSYDVPADTIALSGISSGSGLPVGLTATPVNGNVQLANFGVPITLSAPQQWDIAGGLLYMNSITGSPLTLNTSNQGTLQANDLETGSATINGNGTLQLDQFGGSPEKLPNVTVNDTASLVVAPRAAPRARSRSRERAASPTSTPTT
jgi:hypothetical protein